MGRPSELRVLALCLAPLDRSPSQRFRIEQWVPYFRALGIHIELNVFMLPELEAILYQPRRYAEKALLLFKAMARRAKCLRHADEFDLVYVLRETSLLGPALFERWMRLKKIPYVYDFDDAIFLPNTSPANRRFGFLKFPGKTATACRLAAHVMACNDYLADYARKYNPHVTVVPLTIDTNRHRPPDKPLENPRPLLVWTGSPTTTRYLESLSGALLRLRKQHDFKLRIIGAPKASLPGIDVEMLPWESGTEVQNLYGAWAGLMPVPNNGWARGKGGTKGLQYMAVGVPVVCSPTGMGEQLVRDGENGFLASSEDEWVQKLSLLINSEELRRRLAQAGRKTIESWYSAEVQVPRVCEIFRSVSRTATADVQASVRPVAGSI